MGLGEWIGENWFVFLQSAGIIGSLLFTGISYRRDAKARRIENLIKVQGDLRDIWTEFAKQSHLSRVIDPKADIAKPVTAKEQVFVTLIVLHLSGMYHAIREGLLVKPEGMNQDIKEFLSLPVPLAVWEMIKSLQDREFVQFVEACLRGGAPLPSRRRWRLFGRK
jgi:hypothetical protein